jgi:lipopolysaccharide biosynthesis glycosyltransferase
VRSLVECHRVEREVRLVILDGGISAKNRERLEESWSPLAQVRGVGWEFAPPQGSCTRSSPVWGRMPPLTYARLAVPEYFEESAGKAIVLDSDLVVLRDLSDLYDFDLEGAPVAATRDAFIPRLSSPSGLACWREDGLAGDLPYFSAGVLLADLRRWREERTTDRALEYIRQRPDALNHFDQDPINAVLAGRWKELDARWQVHPRSRFSLGLTPREDAWIAHFSGRLKPWLYRADNRFDRLFFETLDRTAWRGFRPPDNLRAWGLRLYDSPVRRLLYPLERRLLGWKRRRDRQRS